MFGGILTRVFPIKTFLYMNPIPTIFFVAFTNTVFLSYLLRIFEDADKVHHDGSHELQQTFGNIGNAYWFLWVTYTTGNIELIPSRIWRLLSQDEFGQVNRCDSLDVWVSSCIEYHYRFTRQVNPR
jgi:hypothetical protein